MLENQPFGIYIHAPFCIRKCGYCDFYSVEGNEAASAWADAVIEEIRAVAPALRDRQADTFYVGGGTPSFVPARLLSMLVNAVNSEFDLSGCVERTIECNPGALSPETAAALAGMGFNRASLGAQSFNESELRFLNRAHSVDDIYAAVDALKAAGFANFNLDLIFGIPGQLLRDFDANLRRALRLSPRHLSVYGLTIEEGTPLYARFEKNEFERVHDERYEGMFLTAHALLEAQGFRHYEISNYSIPGSEALHNLNCWRGRDYVGLGPSAHSRNGLMRWANPCSLSGYLADPRHHTLMGCLTDDQARLERIMLGLRTLEGLPRSLCGSRGAVDKLKSRRLLTETGGNLHLTADGMLLIDEIILLLEGDTCLTLN